MNPKDDPIKDLSEIRSMMERSSKFLSLSGLAGVSAGIVALVGAAAAGWHIRNNEGNSEQRNLLTFFVLDATIVLILALLLAIFFTTRMAKRKGLSVWGSTTKYLLMSLLIPLAAGGIFCMILWYHGLAILIAPSTLIFYGLALLNTTKYTLEEIRYLALFEIGLGLMASLLLDSWLIMWALGFGILHIVYGIFMYMKYER